MDKSDVRPGDWVRAFVDGRLVIGDVEYIRWDPYGWQAITDVGALSIEQILEARSRRGRPRGAQARKGEEYEIAKS